MTKNLKRLLNIIIVMLPCFTSFAQETLGKREVIEQALKYNYDIQVANNNITSAMNNASIYNSGYLPTISGTAGATYNISTSNVTFADGSERAISGLKTNSYNSRLNINYTLYDGNGRKYSFKSLKETYNLTQLQARQIIETSLISIFTIYYDVARLTQNQMNLIQSINISRERLQRARYGFEYGQNTQLDVLNSEVNFNTDSINYLNVSQELENTKRNLNYLLGRDISTTFNVDTTVVYMVGLTLDGLLTRALQNNVQLLQDQSAIKSSKYEIISSKSGYIPKINLTLGYGWDQRDNGSVSFLTNSSSYGPTASATLSWNLFDGGLTRIRLQGNKINLENRKIVEKQNEQLIKRNLVNAWGGYQNSLFVLKAESKNLETNRLNFERTQEQNKLGQITSIVFREAQQNLLQSQLNFNKAKYDAKIAELALLQLSGDLLTAEF